MPARNELGPGTLRAEFLYSSGDGDPADDKAESLQTYYGEYWYGSHSLALLTRDDLALTTDKRFTTSRSAGVVPSPRRATTCRSARRRRSRSTSAPAGPPRTTATTVPCSAPRRT
jgi:hypothetical protein